MDVDDAIDLVETWNIETMNAQIREYICHGVNYMSIPSIAEFVNRYSPTTEITEEDEEIIAAVMKDFMKRRQAN
jgi:hypothetical protein